MTSLSKPSYNYLVQGLGWFSIGLGLAELLAPRQLDRASGLRTPTGLLRSYGLREIAAGIGILLSENPRPWLWGRVVGDAFDLATAGATGDTRRPKRLGATLLTLLGAGAVDFLAATATPDASAPRTNKRRLAGSARQPS